MECMHYESTGQNRTISTSIFTVNDNAGSDTRDSKLGNAHINSLQSIWFVGVIGQVSLPCTLIPSGGQIRNCSGRLLMADLEATLVSKISCIQHSTWHVDDRK